MLISVMTVIFLVGQSTLDNDETSTSYAAQFANIESQYAQLMDSAAQEAEKAAAQRRAGEWRSDRFRLLVSSASVQDVATMTVDDLIAIGHSAEYIRDWATSLRYGLVAHKKDPRNASALTLCARGSLNLNKLDEASSFAMKAGETLHAQHSWGLIYPVLFKCHKKQHAAWPELLVAYTEATSAAVGLEKSASTGYRKALPYLAQLLEQRSTQDAFAALIAEHIRRIERTLAAKRSLFGQDADYSSMADLHALLCDISLIVDPESVNQRLAAWSTELKQLLVMHGPTSDTTAAWELLAIYCDNTSDLITVGDQLMQDLDKVSSTCLANHSENKLTNSLCATCTTLYRILKQSDINSGLTTDTLTNFLTAVNGDMDIVTRPTLICISDTPQNTRRHLDRLVRVSSTYHMQASQRIQVAIFERKFRQETEPVIILDNDQIEVTRTQVVALPVVNGLIYDRLPIWIALHGDECVCISGANPRQLSRLLNHLFAGPQSTE